MTVVVIVTKTHDFQVKGETQTYENVKQIIENERGNFELVKGKNWSILVNKENNRIEIL